VKFDDFVYAHKTIGLLADKLDQLYKVWLKLPFEEQVTIPEQDYPFRGTLASVITSLQKWHRATGADWRAMSPKDWMPPSPGDVRASAFRTRPDLEPSARLFAKLDRKQRDFLSRLAGAFQYTNELASIIGQLDRQQQKTIMRGYPLKDPLDEVIEGMETWYRTVERAFAEAGGP
jgi:hypothetical protein